MSNFVDYYKVLGVSFHATRDQIKKAYKIKVKLHHPDVGGKEQDFIKINQAFQTLIDDERRAIYNEQLAQFRYNAQNKQSSQYNNKGQKENKRTGKQQSELLKFNPLRLFVICSIGINIIMILLNVLLFTFTNNLERNTEGLYTNMALIESTIDNIVHEKEAIETKVNGIHRELVEVKEHVVLNVKQEYVSNAVSSTDSLSDNYFTLYSTKDEVKEIMGPPDSIIGNQWGYGLSTVTFENDNVIGWSDTSQNLMVHIKKSEQNLSTFTIGSSKQDVIDVMGTPTTIVGNTWGYQLSTVVFNDNMVESWINNSKNLLIH